MTTYAAATSATRPGATASQASAVLSICHQKIPIGVVADEQRVRARARPAASRRTTRTHRVDQPEDGRQQDRRPISDQATGRPRPARSCSRSGTPGPVLARQDPPDARSLRGRDETREQRHTREDQQTDDDDSRRDADRERQAEHDERQQAERHRRGGVRQRAPGPRRAPGTATGGRGRPSRRRGGSRCSTLRARDGPRGSACATLVSRTGPCPGPRFSRGLEP